jgi:hypothetical protein
MARYFELHSQVPPCHCTWDGMPHFVAGTTSPIGCFNTDLGWTHLISFLFPVLLYSYYCVRQKVSSSQ